MEANKIDSERCLSIAKREALNGNYEKAIKFVEKSLKLYPSESAQDLLKEYKENLINSKSKTESNTKSSEKNTHNHKNDNENSNNSNLNSSSNHSHKEYSAEQVDAVKKIKSCRDFYEILGVPKTSSDADLKKAYRKLALQFHPDKNKAPGATDAFKAIGKAFAILSDAQKRKQYDQLGPDSFEDSPSPSTSTTRNRYQGRSYNSNFNTYYWNDDDFSADELFNLFFGSGAGFNTASRNRNHHPHQRHSHANTQPNYVFNSSNNYAVLFQLMPILLIVFLSLLSNLMISEPVYSLNRNNKYSVKRTTNEHKVLYYVKNDFKIDSASELAKLERQVEEELHMELRQNCFREKTYKETAIWRARNYGDERVLKRAMEYETPSCDRIKNIFGGG